MSELSAKGDDLERLNGLVGVELLRPDLAQAVPRSHGAKGGQTIDAMLVACPKQCNTEEEKREIKAGQIPQGWKQKPAKLAQKDHDARWTVKWSKAKPAGRFEKPSRFAVWAASVSLFSEGGGGGWAAWVL